MSGGWRGMIMVVPGISNGTLSMLLQCSWRGAKERTSLKQTTKMSLEALKLRCTRSRV